MYFKYRFIIDIAASAAVVIIIKYLRSPIRIFDSLDADGLRDFLIGLFATSTALLGFVLAASTFLISKTESKRFDLLRKSQSYPLLLRIFTSSLWRLWLLTCSSVIAVFAASSWQIIFEHLILFFGLFAFFGISSLIWVSAKIIRITDR